MQRGVDTELFTPARRTRAAGNGKLVLGFVGRLSVEKNVALIPRIDRELQARGIAAQWLIVGHGAEEAALAAAVAPERLVGGKLAGVLRGDDLANAYANMDLLVFPSHTDTFGNVVLEALASGVPAIVTPDGGPAHIVRDTVTGRIATDDGFAGAIADSVADADALAAMRSCARNHALHCSWDAVFQRVVAAYPASRGEAVQASAVNSAVRSKS
jgi:glycosyltransferase involved in cell wall biosynthesis